MGRVGWREEGEEGIGGEGREGKKLHLQQGTTYNVHVCTSVTNGMLPNIGIGTDVYIYTLMNNLYII